MLPLRRYCPQAAARPSDCKERRPTLRKCQAEPLKLARCKVKSWIVEAQLSEFSFLSRRQRFNWVEGCFNVGTHRLQCCARIRNSANKGIAVLIQGTIQASIIYTAASWMQASAIHDLAPDARLPLANGAMYGPKEVAPRCLRLQHPKDVFEDTPVVSPCYAPRPDRQQRLDGNPYVVSKFTAHNSQPSVWRLESQACEQGWRNNVRIHLFKTKRPERGYQLGNGWKTKPRGRDTITQKEAHARKVASLLGLPIDEARALARGEPAHLHRTRSGRNPQ
jgi:hypothetical protein